MGSKGIRLAGLLLLLAVTLTYSNHFQNGFHFDDFHTVSDNPNIRSLKTAARFFTDTSTFSIRPALRTYRPVVTLSLAVDYWLGSGLNLFYFHLDMFLWYLAQLALMFLLFRHILRLASSEPWTDWAALFAVALYGLHPAMAETVNYIIQRGDLYSTALVVAALAIYALAPRLRRFGMYLIPLAAAMLTKPPAAIFPAILFAYVFLFEERRLVKALRQCAPSILVVAALMWLQVRMTPATFNPAAPPAGQYLATQPWAALHYFLMFFAPVGLTASSDQEPLRTVFCFEGMAGLAFLLAVAGAIYAAAKRERLRPVAFGLAWFLLALVPTSVFPLAEIENDHRMFFPFVGLALAAGWGAALLATRAPAPFRRQSALAAAMLILAACAWGAHQRNRIWRDDETLWRDATVKSPRSGSALMNYGHALLEDSQPAAALDYLQRAFAYLPYDIIVEDNLAGAYATLQMDESAEGHYLHAMRIAPRDPFPNYYYGSWLQTKGRMGEAIAQFQAAIARNPNYLEARSGLMQAYSKAGMQPEAKAAAAETLRIDPGNMAALDILHGRAVTALAAAEAAVAQAPTAENYLQLSGLFGNAERFRDCIHAAEEALKLRPGLAAAYTNIAGAHTMLHEWDAAIAADAEALRLKPNSLLAQRSLAYAERQKKLAKAGNR